MNKCADCFKIEKCIRASVEKGICDGFRKQTRYEKLIQKMTVERLANFFESRCGNHCAFEGRDNCQQYGCENGIVEWLNEVEE